MRLVLSVGWLRVDVALCEPELMVEPGGLAYVTAQTEIAPTFGFGPPGEEEDRTKGVA